WLIEGVLAGCGRPGGPDRRGHKLWSGGGSIPGPDDQEQQRIRHALDDDLAWLASHGIGAVLSLTETPLARGAIEQYGMEGLHLPIDDLTSPTPEQLDLALAFIDRQRAQGRKVAVHCLMGQGRTGTVLAAYLVRGGATAEAALRELRAVCPGAVGTPEQERALHAFERRRDWIV
ncbi:MAG TPA: dual specificity protein phosphatase family protein, partial [Ktedonobacterales bacterium]